MRFNFVGLVLGERGTGKSLFIIGSKYTCKTEDKNLGIPGIIDTYLHKHNMKVLVIDTLDHPAYRNFPVLKQVDFKNFKSGYARVFMEPDDIVTFTDLINRSPHMNNTLLIYEDAGKYTGSRLQGVFKRVVGDSKQRNLDIVFMYHCWIDTPSNIFTKADFIQLFKTGDSPMVRKNNLRLFDRVMGVYSNVNSNSSKFYGEYIDTRTN